MLSRELGKMPNYVSRWMLGAIVLMVQAFVASEELVAENVSYMTSELQVEVASSGGALAIAKRLLG